MRTRKLQQFNFAATPPSRLVVVDGRLRGHDEMVEKPCPPEPEGSADRAGTNHDCNRVEEHIATAEGSQRGQSPV